jgi:hypothetical protein
MPILSWEKFFLVQPGINPAFGEKSLVELAQNRLVLRGMAEEDFEKAFFGRHGFVPPNLFDEIIRQVEVICYC